MAVKSWKIAIKSRKMTIKNWKMLEDSPLIQVIFQPLSYSPPTNYAISGRYGRFFHVLRFYICKIIFMRFAQNYLF